MACRICGQKENILQLAIQADGRTFECHKLVLASSSVYFHKMFSSTFKESKESLITIKDVTVDALEVALSFMYTQSVKLDGLYT